MSRTKLLIAAVVVAIAGLMLWLHERNSAPPLVPFATVVQENLVSTLPTNGKVEPSEWVSVRAQRPGSIEKLAVQKGQQIGAGTLIAELETRDARADVAAAEAAVSQAQAQLDTVSEGGAPSAQVDIRNELDRSRIELAAARKDRDATQRLVDKRAATGQELLEANQRVQKLEASIEALDRKRSALVGTGDRKAAQARLDEAKATLAQARARLERSRLDTPLAGIVYDLPVRTGAYVNAGDLVASVGNLRTLRIRIYVDEPELGRVAVGMPVKVTWDAVPGREWKGTVEKMPVEVAPLGTRQVGEVICTIDNPDLRLLPGTNVNVEITSQVVNNGLTIPKEALRTENGQTGVYLLRDDHVEWRPVQIGAASVTRAVVTSGLEAGMKVALRSDQPLRNNDKVRPAVQ